MFCEFSLFRLYIILLKHAFLIYVTSLEFNNIFSFEGKYGSDAHVSL